MIRSAWLNVLAAGLSALCLSTASATERVTLNETVLDCLPEGCFVVRYVPAPSLKAEIDERNEIGDEAENNDSEPEVSPQGSSVERPIVASGKQEVSASSDETVAGQNHGEGTVSKNPPDWTDKINLLFSGVLVLSTAFLWRNAGRQSKTMHDTLAHMKADAIAQAEQFNRQLAVAQQGADAASALATVSAEQFLTLRKQLRPNLKVEKMSVTFPIEEEGHFAMRLKLVLMNHGNGNAINVTTRGICAWLTAKRIEGAAVTKQTRRFWIPDADFGFYKTHHGMTPNPTTVKPNEPAVFEYVAIPQFDIVQMIENDEVKFGGWQFESRIVIEYETVLGETKPWNLVGSGRVTPPMTAESVLVAEIVDRDVTKECVDYPP